jgi:hypothetical protein
MEARGCSQLRAQLRFVVILKVIGRHGHAGDQAVAAGSREEVRQGEPTHQTLRDLADQFAQEVAARPLLKSVR